MHRQLLGWVVCALLLGCASPPPRRPVDTAQILDLLPAQGILLGEQHDAPDHQRIERQVVETLANQKMLAAVVLEMAITGQSTQGLAPNADETLVQSTLQWDNNAWPWALYGPVVMTAVRAGVPVLGANLPPMALRDAMGNAELERSLPGPVLKAQQQNIRLGHCEMLPESQIAPMTRIQIARDKAMAQTLADAVRPGLTVVLLAGHAHVDRTQGIPQHLPASFKAKVILLGAQAMSESSRLLKFDHLWPAQSAPRVDYCAQFKAGLSTLGTAALP